MWIELSDGCRLSARLWLPDEAGADHCVPAILEYLPYRKNDATAAEDASRHPYFAARGFAGVRVDIRGTGDSEGVCLGEYLEQEHADAIEVLAWLAEQDWCTGSVGMIGYSWGGFNGLQVAALRPPQLKAVVSLYAADDRYADDCHYAGGCVLGGDMPKWASWMLAFNARPPDPAAVGPEWRERWLERLESTPSYLPEWLAHQRDDGFWRHGSVAQDYAAISAPVLVVGGWADAYTNAVPRLLENLTCERRGIIGPWGHVFPQRGVPGPAIGFLQQAVRWFEHWLLGTPNGVMDEPMLRVWMQDTLPPADFYAERPGCWVAEGAWPPPDVHLIDIPVAPTCGGPLVLEADQSCGHAAGVWCANGLPHELAIDQSYDDDRSLLFETAVLAEEVEVLGRPVARFTVSFDRPQANLAVRLSAVGQDGASTLLTWGALNMSRREGSETSKPIVPGEAYSVEIALNAIGERIPRGTRLRLGMSTSYWPQLWPSPEPVRPTLSGAQPCTLMMPVRDGVTVQPEVAFLPPEASEPVCGEITQSAERTRERRVAPDGCARIEDHQSYACRISATGTDYRHAGTDVWTVSADDPLSARAECSRRVSIDRDGWHTRVETHTVLESDATAFRITNEVAAFDNGEEVFRHTLHTRIERDGV